MTEKVLTLKEQMLVKKAEGLAKFSKEVAETFKNDLEINLKAKTADKALKVGDKIPDFILNDALGKPVSSKELLAKGPLVISFYRGGWCPYCNLELRAYQTKLEKIHALGAEFVAISGANPDDSLPVIEKNNLKFEVLSDPGSKVITEFGLLIQMSEEIKAIYKSAGLDLVTAYGNDNYELPMPGTFVVASDGTIVEAFVSYDYTSRLEPEDAIIALEKLK